MNTETKQQEQTIKVPRYFMHGKHKCMTPRDIVPFDVEGYNSIVYGDKRLSSTDIAFDKNVLQDAKKRGYLILVLKKSKKRGKMVGVPVPYINVLESRKKRLANFVNMERLSVIDEEKQNINLQATLAKELDAVGLSLSRQELMDKFLISSKDSIICSDLKRIIHLKFEESWNNGK